MAHPVFTTEKGIKKRKFVYSVKSTVILREIGKYKTLNAKQKKTKNVFENLDSSGNDYCYMVKEFQESENKAYLIVKTRKNWPVDLGSTSHITTSKENSLSFI